MSQQEGSQDSIQLSLKQPQESKEGAVQAEEDTFDIFEGDGSKRKRQRRRKAGRRAKAADGLIPRENLKFRRVGRRGGRRKPKSVPLCNDNEQSYRNKWGPKVTASRHGAGKHQHAFTATTRNDSTIQKVKRAHDTDNWYIRNSAARAVHRNKDWLARKHSYSSHKRQAAEINASIRRSVEHYRAMSG